MKALRVFLLAIVLIMASGATAQTIRNSSGSSCGQIESNGTIRNSSGSSIGKIDSDGTVRNGSGSSIGKVESDGTVRNSSGSSIGKAEGVRRDWAAAYFFFFPFY